VEIEQFIQQIDVIILAAGTSSRMGSENKLLLDHNSKSLIQHSLDQLLELPFNQYILVTGHENEKLLSSINFKEALTVTHNPAFETGQTSSIKSGLACVSSDADYFMICLSDMPFLTTNLIKKFLSFACMEHASISRPWINQSPGHPVLFAKKYADELLACTDSNGCRTVIQANMDSLVKYKTEEEAYIKDIDLPKDKEYLS